MHRATKEQPYRKNRWLFYRTQDYSLQVLFAKDPTTQKYYLKQAKSNGKIDCTDETQSFHTIYDVAFILDTFYPFGNFKVKKNVKTSKDIFKLKHPYRPEFWKNQHHLLLTQEMEAFIKQLQTPGASGSINSNFH